MAVVVSMARKFQRSVLILLRPFRKNAQRCNPYVPLNEIERILDQASLKSYQRSEALSCAGALPFKGNNGHFIRYQYVIMI